MPGEWILRHTGAVQRTGLHKTPVFETHMVHGHVAKIGDVPDLALCGVDAIRRGLPGRYTYFLGPDREPHVLARFGVAGIFGLDRHAVCALDADAPPVAVQYPALEQVHVADEIGDETRVRSFVY